ncbi:MAG: response regulator transcription factor [Candidatus Dormibacteria bacterium]
MTTGRLRLVVADDQASVRDGLVALLSTLADFEVVGAAGDGASALALVESTAPDAVLMDLRMPGMDGVEATERLARSHPELAVVVLTTFADDESVIAALQAGARAYLTKNATRADIARAIKAAVVDKVTLDGEVHRSLLSAALRGQQAIRTEGLVLDPWPDGLTDREGQILMLIGSGHSNREIGSQLFIGNATVKTHVNRIFAKLGVSNRDGAVACAHRLMAGTRTPGPPLA